jgi:hypothetical protein
MTPRTANAAQGGGEHGSRKSTSRRLRSTNRNATTSETDLYRVPSARVDADVRERRRSALLGVDAAARAHREAEERFVRARAARAEAIVAARDEGCTVEEIAQQSGQSRQSIYLLMHRAKGRSGR